MSLLAVIVLLLVAVVVCFAAFKLFTYCKRRQERRGANFRSVFGLRKHDSVKGEVIELQELNTPESNPGPSVERFRPEPTAPPERIMKYIYSVGTGCLTIVELVVNSVKTQCLMDTGANISLISNDFRRQIGAQLYPNKRDSFAVSMSGHTLDTMGTSEIIVRLSKTVSFSMSVTVVGSMQHAVVLGTDFFEKSDQTTFDYKKKVIKIRGAELPMVSTGANCARFSVNFLESVRIPPRCEVVMPCKVSDGHEGQDHMFEPSKKLFERYGLHAARSLISVKDSSVLVRLLNPQTQPVQVYKNATVGELQPLAPDDEIRAFAVQNRDVPGNPQSRKTEETRQRHTSLTRSELHLGENNLTREEQTELLAFLDANSDVFAKDEFDIGRCKLLQHTIDTQGSRPIKQRPYRPPYNKRQVSPIINR